MAAFGLLLLTAPSFAQDKYQWADRSKSASESFLAWKTSVEAEPCCAPSSNGKRPYAGEAALLDQLKGSVARDDATLRLTLDGGHVLKMTDCLDAEVCKSVETESQLVGWWPVHRYYLVRVSLPGTYSVFLISEKNGRATEVAALPVLSPSGRYAVALESSPILDVRLNVVDLTVDPPKVIDIDKPGCAGFGRQVRDPEHALLRPHPVWVDDSHVRFEGAPEWPNVDLDTKQLLNIAGARPAWEC